MSHTKRPYSIEQMYMQLQIPNKFLKQVKCPSFTDRTFSPASASITDDIISRWLI